MRNSECGIRTEEGGVRTAARGFIPHSAFRTPHSSMIPHSAFAAVPKMKPAAGSGGRIPVAPGPRRPPPLRGESAMSHALRLPLAAAVLALAAGPAPAAPAPDAGKNAVLPYPAKAPVVVHVNGLEQVRDRLGKAMTAAAPD